MITACKMTQCPYHDRVQQFCRRRIVSIDENGMCSVIWRRGQQRQPEKAMYFNDLNIVDAKEREEE